VEATHYSGARTASTRYLCHEAETISQQTDGADETQMQGYQDRSKYREVVGTKYARELILK